MIDLTTILHALLGGVLPALIWLIFWLREDRRNPEPKRIVGKTFVFGMISVILVLPVQKVIDISFPNITVTAIVLWVVVEEVFKYVAAYLGGLRLIDNNEPIDPMIYMITAALGFVALENTLFIFGPLISNDVFNGILTGNMRFIGASILHVVSSGIIGMSLAFSYYRPRLERFIYALIAMLIAIALHSIFNLSILFWSNFGTMIAFIGVWMGAILLLIAFEKAKTIAR